MKTSCMIDFFSVINARLKFQLLYQEMKKVIQFFFAFFWLKITWKIVSLKIEGSFIIFPIWFTSLTPSQKHQKKLKGVCSFLLPTEVPFYWHVCKKVAKYLIFSQLIVVSVLFKHFSNADNVKLAGMFVWGVTGLSLELRERPFGSLEEDLVEVASQIYRRILFPSLCWAIF